MARVLKSFALVAIGILVSATVVAQEIYPIALPAPQMKGGKPVMEALALRSTGRDYSGVELPLQTLSNLLWAAWGFNRPQVKDFAGNVGMRTAPSAMDWQETDIYVFMNQGVFVYDARKNTLSPVVGGDYRAMTGTQPYVKDAPVSLVFVADTAKMKDAGDLLEPMKWADVGFISENIYIFAASEGLATGVRALIDRPALAKLLKLRPEQSITLAQSVAFPKK